MHLTGLCGLYLKTMTSVFDEIYHPDYLATDPTTGITVNLEDEKLVLSTYSEDYILGLFRIVYESDDFYVWHRYDLANKRSNPIYYAIVFMIKYKDGLITTQESVRELLDQYKWAYDRKLIFLKHHLSVKFLW